MSFNIITEFENKIAEFYGAPYAVAVDCCTHGIELCLIYSEADFMFSPRQTYISVPFLSKKLRIDLIWTDQKWQDWYTVWGEGENGLTRILDNRIIDAAVLWKRNSYMSGTFMNISFQFRKHLSLGRGGIILTDNKEAAIELKKMSYDGRLPDVPWRDQDIDTMGYHYYMTPETAQLGLDKLEDAINTEPKEWTIDDWPDVSRMEIFQ